MADRGEEGSVYYIDRELLARQLRRERERVDREIADTREVLALVEAADRALARVEAILAEMKGLAVRAATEPEADLPALDRDFQARKEALGRVVEDADFGGYNLLDGSLGSIEEAVALLEAALGRNRY